MVVMLPNPVLDPGAAHAAETTVGGSGMLRSISTKGREASVTVMKRKVIIFHLDGIRSDAFYKAHGSFLSDCILFIYLLIHLCGNHSCKIQANCFLF